MSSLRCFLSSECFWSGLLGVELDDELLLDRRRDLGALGVAQDLGGQGVVVGLQPSRDRRNQFRRAADRVGRAGGRFDRDDVLGTHLVRGDVDAAAVDQPVAVVDQLAGLAARGGEAETHQHVVEAGLEQPEQILAGAAVWTGGVFVVGAELFLQHLVVAAGLLLLAQLQAVLALAQAAAAVIAGRVGATLDTALVGEAALTLEEEFLGLDTALLALGGSVA